MLHSNLLKINQLNEIHINLDKFRISPAVFLSKKLISCRIIDLYKAFLENVYLIYKEESDFL